MAIRKRRTTNLIENAGFEMTTSFISGFDSLTPNLQSCCLQKKKLNLALFPSVCLKSCRLLFSYFPFPRLIQPRVDATCGGSSSGEVFLLVPATLCSHHICAFKATKQAKLCGLSVTADMRRCLCSVTGSDDVGLVRVTARWLCVGEARHENKQCFFFFISARCYRKITDKHFKLFWGFLLNS